MNPVLTSTLLALIAAGSLVFGAALPSWPWLKSRLFEDRLSLLIGFSAGLMLATAFLELLPEAAAASPDQWMWGAAAGFLILYMAERLTHFHACRHRHCDVAEDDPATHDHHHAHHTHEHHHDHAEHHHHDGAQNGLPGGTGGGTQLKIANLQVTAPHSPLTSHHTHSHARHADSMAMVGMSIHNFADGLTTAAAFAVSHTVGIVVVLAIVMHQMAAGLSLGAIMLRMGRSHRTVLLATSVVASFIVWGALFYHYVVPLREATQGTILGLAGGSFLYVAACDLLPEAHAEDEGWTVMATTFAGCVFALAVKLLFE